MENVPISVRLCRTMDVLTKFEIVPSKLRDSTKEAISNLIIRALCKNQIHSEASPTSPASVSFKSTVWKFRNFSATQILREINFRDFRS